MSNMKKKNQKCCFLLKQTLSGIIEMKGQGAPMGESFSSFIRSFHIANSLGLKLKRVAFQAYMTWCLMISWNGPFATSHPLDKQLPAISTLINLVCLVQPVTLLVQEDKS